MTTQSSIVSSRCVRRDVVSFPFDGLNDLWSNSQDFMIQGGDPTGTGRGGASVYGYRLHRSCDDCAPD